MVNAGVAEGAAGEAMPMRDRLGPRDADPAGSMDEQVSQPPGRRRRVVSGEPAPLSRGRAGDAPGSEGPKEHGRQGGERIRDRRAGEAAQAPRMRRARPGTDGSGDGKAAADAWRRAQQGRTGRLGQADRAAPAGAAAADRKPTYRPWFATTRDSAPWFTESTAESTGRADATGGQPGGARSGGDRPGGDRPGGGRPDNARPGGERGERPES